MCLLLAWVEIGEHLYLYPSQCITLRWRWRMGSFPSSTVIFPLLFRRRLGRASFVSSIVCLLYKRGGSYLHPPQSVSLNLIQITLPQSPPKLEGDTVDYANEPLPQFSPKLEGNTLWMKQMSPSPTSLGRYSMVDANEPLPHLHSKHCGQCKSVCYGKKSRSKVEVKSGSFASSTKHHHQLQMWWKRS